MIVSDVMSYEVYTVAPTKTVKELLFIFAKNRLDGVPVVDFKGRLLGTVTDGDIVQFLSPQQKVYLTYFMSYINVAESIEEVLRQKMNTPIIEIMSKKNIKTLSPDDDFERAIRLISKHHIKMLPVVNEDGMVVGIISREDIIHHLSKMTVENDLSTIL
jgi:CBS domain-containing protein